MAETDAGFQHEVGTAPVRFGAGAPDGDDWVGLFASMLPVADASGWVARPDCGAVVVFTGTARDHSEGRRDVDLLVYEAYDELAVPRLADVVAEMRVRWPSLGRVVALHRTGEVPIGEAAVIVAVSAPHRDEAFVAARFGIDAVKASVPIWKRERWRDGEDWGLGSRTLVTAGDVGAHVIDGDVHVIGDADTDSPGGVRP